jgi:hypothetical protein
MSDTFFSLRGRITAVLPASSVDQISSTVASALSDHFKTSERTVFWDDYLKMNVDPFERMEGGIFAASWDLKVRLLISQNYQRSLTTIRTLFISAENTSRARGDAAHASARHQEHHRSRMGRGSQ